MNKKLLTIIGVAVIGVLVLAGMALAMTGNGANSQVVDDERPLLIQDLFQEDEDQADDEQTDEQTDEAPARPFPRGERFGRGPAFGGRDFLDQEAIKEATADALGITVEELEAAHQEGTRIEDLAGELDVDIADVEAAVQAAKEEALAQAVAEDLITQEQADAILEGNFRFGPHRGRPHGFHPDVGFVNPDDVRAATADALGITVEELEAARDEGTRIEDLAEELGVDIADVEAAVKAVHEAAIQQAVEDGLITQEQADAMLNNIDRFGVGKLRLGEGIIDCDAIKEAAADALGITVEELEAAHEEGTRLPDLAEELGVDLADVEAAVQAAREAAVQQAVQDGLITQEQADQILSGNGFRDGRRGGPGGFRGPRGGNGFFNAPDNSNATDAPAAESA
jgi:uncharacterized protein (DUF433 family)